MELLIIKSGDRYLRLKNDRWIAVGLDKASVFPMATLEGVKGHLDHVRQHGFPDAAIYRLRLAESPLEEVSSDETGA